MYISKKKTSILPHITDFDRYDNDKNLLKSNRLDLLKKAVLGSWLEKKKTLLEKKHDSLTNP